MFSFPILNLFRGLRKSNAKPELEDNEALGGGDHSVTKPEAYHAEHADREECEAYSIYTPGGEYICDVYGTEDMRLLLSHLNRK